MVLWWPCSPQSPPPHSPSPLPKSSTPLDKRITRLEDLNQIEKLQRLYGYFVDKGQWTQLSELFADDATLEIGGKGLFLGKKRVLDYMQTAFGPDGARERRPCQSHAVPDAPRCLGGRHERLDPLARLGDEQRRLGPAAL